MVLERLPVPALAVGQDGAILFANGAFAEMIGHSADTLLSLNYRQIFHTLPADEPALASVSAHGGLLVHLRHVDGSIVRARMSKSALLRGNDPVALATFHDMTEQLWIAEK